MESFPQEQVRDVQIDGEPEEEEEEEDLNEEEEPEKPAPKEKAPQVTPSSEGPLPFLLRGFFLLGIDMLQYQGDELPASASEGSVNLEYPNKYSGPVLRLGAQAQFSLEQLLPNLLGQTGLDLTYGLGAKSDRPLRATSMTGDQVLGETDYSFSYSYIALFGGLAYYFPQIKSYLSFHFRLPSFGSYTEKLTQRAGTRSGSKSSKGTIRGNGLSLGFTRELLYLSGPKLNFSFMLSQDYLAFSEEKAEGESDTELITKYSNTFLGIGVSMDF